MLCFSLFYYISFNKYLLSVYNLLGTDWVLDIQHLNRCPLNMMKWYFKKVDILRLPWWRSS